MSDANKPPLYVHRIRLLVLEIYKIIHSIGPKYLDDMFTIKNTTYNMRDNMKLIVPKPKTVKYGKRSLKYEGSRLWNLLTNATKLAVNFKVFKHFIMLWQGPDCKCFNCDMCKLSAWM